MNTKIFDEARKKGTMRSFFNPDEFVLTKIQSEDKNCNQCGLFKFAKSPKMEITGKGKKNILIIAEAPGKTEDEKNKQLTGSAGEFFRSKLNPLGIDLDEDCWKTNAVRCRPFTETAQSEKNRAPTKKELQLCRNHYLKFIEKEKPKFIWLMGKSAIESFYSGRFSDDSGTDLTPTRWRGLCIPDPTVNAWVIPMFHPSYAMRNEYDDLTISQYERDIRFAIQCLKKPLPTFFNPYDKVECLTSFNHARSVLQDIIHNPPEIFSFDYETTGLKPFNKGHKIVSVSYCDSKDVAYSFPLQHISFNKDQWQILCNLWNQILVNDAKKVAQNLKFEDVWSQQILNTKPYNWHWCTMNASHILDNRASFSGLKFQSFIRWGIEDYDKEMRSFIRSKNGSEFNMIEEAPLDKLLLYNGIDALLTLKLYHEQRKEMSENQLKVMTLFNQGLDALADIQMNGICASKEFYQQTNNELEQKIINLFKELHSSDEAKLFKKEMGRDINFTSDHDMRILLFDILKLKSEKTTDSGIKSVDAEVLNTINIPLTKKLVAANKLDKVKGTYIGQFLREIDQTGKMRPFFDLHKADTGRSSSSSPNWQNVPVRDEDAKKYTRSGIFPSKGNIILGFDYKALEVSICACISQDPELIKYCADPTKDMHRDQATELFVLKKDNVSDSLRFYAKNGFVFPEIYNSYYKSCARNLWEIMHKENLKTKDGIDTIDHLIDVGVCGDRIDYQGFEDHVKKVETKFWRRFNKVKQWQDRMIAFYMKYGYIELVTGFRCQGYMSRNKIANSPIQGPAFHCLLYSLIHCHNKLLDLGAKSKIIGQIHDNLVFDCDPSEKEDLKEMATKIATVQIREDWDWIIVPLMVSWEGTLQDSSWFTQIKGV